MFVSKETRVWPVKSTIRPDIVRWPAVILSPDFIQEKKSQFTVHVKFSPHITLVTAIISNHFYWTFWWVTGHSKQPNTCHFICKKPKGSFDQRSVWLNSLVISCHPVFKEANELYFQLTFKVNKRLSQFPIKMKFVPLWHKF